MIFAVPENFVGSFVLSTLERALSRGMTISITGNDLYAPDVKIAIQRGSLVPVGDDYTKEMSQLSHDIVIVNKTDRVMVLGDIVLKPHGALPISKKALENAAIQAAVRNNFAELISQDKPKKVKKQAPKEVIEEVEEVEEVEEEVFDEENNEFIPGADRVVKAKVWNFQEQESEEAQVVPTIANLIDVTEEEDPEDIDFVDEPKIKVNPKAKKKIAKKKSKKKAVKKHVDKKAVKKTNKKKVSTVKKKKVKALEPVGEKRVPKTQMDAAIELDSRGRPLVEGGSDALNHLIDAETGPEEISFVDGEQAQDRYDNRTDMD